MSELFQLRLLCSVLQLFLISHSLLLLLLSLKLRASQSAPRAHTRRTHTHLPRVYTLFNSACKIHTSTHSCYNRDAHTTTGVYSDSSCLQRFRLIDEVAEEMRRDRLRRPETPASSPRGRFSLRGCELTDASRVTGNARRSFTRGKCCCALKMT